MLNVSCLISTKIGLHLLNRMQFELATKLKGVVIISLPSGIFRLCTAMSRAAVPLHTAMEYSHPIYLENAFSNSLTFDPVVIQFDFRTSITSFISYLSMLWRP